MLVVAPLKLHVSRIAVDYFTRIGTNSLGLSRNTVGCIWQIAHLTKCAARLNKYAHLTNLHIFMAFRQGKA